MTVLRTPRALIRRITPADYDEMMTVYADLELMVYVGDSSAIDPEDCRRWIDITLANYEKRGYGLFIVENLEGDTCFGFIGLTHPGGQDLPEIKYVLKKPYWGSGLATELVSGLTQHASETWQLPEIIATVHPDNAASLRLLEKSGYVRQPDEVDEDGEITAVLTFKQKIGAG